MVTVKLSAPISYEDKTHSEIAMDLDSLTGADMIEAEKELALGGQVAAVAELSKSYLAVLAAKAAKVDPGLIKRLPVKDFAKVTLEVQNFLFG